MKKEEEDKKNRRNRDARIYFEGGSDQDQEVNMDTKEEEEEEPIYANFLQAKQIATLHRKLKDQKNRTSAVDTDERKGNTEITEAQEAKDITEEETKYNNTNNQDDQETIYAADNHNLKNILNKKKTSNAEIKEKEEASEAKNKTEVETRWDDTSNRDEPIYAVVNRNLKSILKRKKTDGEIKEEDAGTGDKSETIYDIPRKLYNKRTKNEQARACGVKFNTYSDDGVAMIIIPTEQTRQKRMKMTAFLMKKAQRREFRKYLISQSKRRCMQNS